MSYDPIEFRRKVLDRVKGLRVRHMPPVLDLPGERLPRYVQLLRSQVAEQREIRRDLLDGGASYPRGFDVEPGIFDAVYHAFWEPCL